MSHPCDPLPETATASIRQLIGQLGLEEKARQLGTSTPAVERLGIKAAHWGVEAAHGPARHLRGTVFPHALVQAASFDPDLVGAVAAATADELRAHDNLPGSNSRLCAWAPVVNLQRDPRWGRGQETYGECPFLAGLLGGAFVRGLQGDHPRLLKLAAVVKHFAVHSGPEADRHRQDVRVDPRDLQESYLPAFRTCLVEARAAGVMGAYNRVDGEAACASPRLLQGVLRQTWGWDGVVFSDGGALADYHGEHGHGLCADAAGSAALALNGGCQVCLGDTFRALPEAVVRGLTSETTLDAALERVLSLRWRLGCLPGHQENPWAGLGEDRIESAEHRVLAGRCARAGSVLLRNNGILPLPRSLGRLGIVGPSAADASALLGNYHGLCGRMDTPLEALVAATGKTCRIVYEPGCPLLGDDRRGVARAASSVQGCDAIVCVLGHTAWTEGEEHDPYWSEHCGDRLSLGLPPAQEALLKACLDTGKPVILVSTGSGSLALPWALERCAAWLHLGFAGCAGGQALADLLFGTESPSGRLPQTWPRSTDHLPPFADYRLDGRGYRFSRHEPLFPFGFGLGYGQVAFRDLELPRQLGHGEQLHGAVTVANPGSRPLREPVQVYLSRLDAPDRVPRQQLVAVRPVELPPGAVRRLEFTVEPAWFRRIDRQGRSQAEPGRYRLVVGDSQGDPRSLRLGAAPTLVGELDAG